MNRFRGEPVRNVSPEQWVTSPYSRLGRREPEVYGRTTYADPCTRTGTKLGLDVEVRQSDAEHELLTAQLYFPGDPHNEDDIASAVKPELVLDTRDAGDGSATVDYGFVLDPEKG